MLKLVLVIMMSILAMRVNSQCVSFASNIDYMTTGVMELGLPTSNIANENYNVIFESSVNLGSYANLFYAFGNYNDLHRDCRITDSEWTEFLFCGSVASIFHKQ